MKRRGSESERFFTAEERWAGFGPYYALFPAEFVKSVVRERTDPGDLILDPFSGRGTAPFAAAQLGRSGVGAEINPVGWIYLSVKSDPAPCSDVIAKLEEVVRASRHFPANERTGKEDFDKFLSLCFAPRVAAFIRVARETLDWRADPVDRTLAAFIIYYLHGKEGQALSNRMTQTKAMWPKYCMKWWSERGCIPPDLDIVKFLGKRIRWRYKKGSSRIAPVLSVLGDSSETLSEGSPAENWILEASEGRGASLLITSPPYLGVTDYHADQWLRLWALGFAPSVIREAAGTPIGGEIGHKGRFYDVKSYGKLLTTVFSNARRLLSHDAAVFVRAGKNRRTLDVVRKVLLSVFPEKVFEEFERPFGVSAQTKAIGNKSGSSGEVDLVSIESPRKRRAA